MGNMDRNMEDRRRKYGYGLLRLGTLVAMSMLGTDSTLTRSEYPWDRALLNVWFGAIGAIINTCALTFTANLGLLSIALLGIVRDVLVHDSATAWYLLKTTAGDALAGKLDSPEWRICLAVIASIAAAVAAWAGADPLWLESAGLPSSTSAATSIAEHTRIFLVLAAVQFVCEFGDARMDQFVFFRHRYSYELLTAAVIVLLPLAAHERRVVDVDLVCCLSYRAFNYALIVLRQLSRAPTLATLLFKLFGLLHYPFSRSYVRVTNPKIALQVLKGVTKGDGLESRLAMPAWAPILSLESVDGEVWRTMRQDFDRLHKIVAPRTADLAPIAQRHVDVALARGAVIDANAITRLAIGIFIEFLFGRCDVDAEIDVLARASWEWRKEIACKGKGRADAKWAAVETTISLLRADAELWNVFGEEWMDPRRYSLIMQPFLISPAINTCDIMVAFNRAADGVAFDDAIRAAHPFPVLERFVESDVVDDETGRVVVPAGTHVLMFADDFSGVAGWPIFSTGRRGCAGNHLARAYLPVLRRALVGHDLFRPEQGHLWSGRNNDAAMGLAETLYFLKTIITAIFFSAKLKAST